MIEKREVHIKGDTNARYKLVSEQLFNGRDIECCLIVNEDSVDSGDSYLEFFSAEVSRQEMETAIIHYIENVSKLLATPEFINYMVDLSSDIIMVLDGQHAFSLYTFNLSIAKENNNNVQH